MTINDPAVGVGITMTHAADISLAANDARIGFVFIRRGILPESRSTGSCRDSPLQAALHWGVSGREVGACRNRDWAPTVRQSHRRLGKGDQSMDVHPGVPGGGNPGRHRFSNLDGAVRISPVRQGGRTAPPP